MENCTAFFHMFGYFFPTLVILVLVLLVPLLEKIISQLDLLDSWGSWSVLIHGNVLVRGDDLVRGKGLVGWKVLGSRNVLGRGCWDKHDPHSLVVSEVGREGTVLGLVSETGWSISTRLVAS